MYRRQLLLASTTGAAVMAGCTGSGSGSDGPDLAVSDARETDPRNIDVSQTRNEFSAEIRNAGISGTVFVELYFTEGGEPSPNPVAQTNTYMESGEQREISFEREPPEWADGYEFQYRGIRYAADVRNNGSAGEVDVWLTDESTGEDVGHRTLTFAAEETRKVDFETHHDFHDGFEIIAAPVEN